MSFDDLMFLIYIFTNLLVFLLLFSLCSNIKNLNHNLYFVFKANHMLGDISEDAILYTKLDKNEIKEKTMPRYEIVFYTIFVICWSISFGLALQAIYGILPIM